MNNLITTTFRSFAKRPTRAVGGGKAGGVYKGKVKKPSFRDAIREMQSGPLDEGNKGSVALGKSQKQKSMKTVKIRNFSQFPTPYWNYLSPDDKTFLQPEYSTQISSLSLPSQSNFSHDADPASYQYVCNLQNLEAYMEDLGEQNKTVFGGQLKQIAFVGRSNVGKSTLLNSILGAPIMKCSKTPGKTAHLHFVTLHDRKAQFVDCPGYGFAKVSSKEKEDWQKFMLQFIAYSPMLHRMVLLVDINAGLMDSDKMLIDMLTELKKVYIVVLTKADKVKSPSMIETRSLEVQNYVKAAGSYSIPIIHAVSSIGGQKKGQFGMGLGYGMYELMSNLVFHLGQELVYLPLDAREVIE